jgi:hypothetical protein
MSQLRRTPRRPRANSPPSNLPVASPPRSRDRGDNGDFLKHPVESDLNKQGSDVKIKVIIKRIDHIDTEKQVSASGTVLGLSVVTCHTSHIILIHDTW